VTEESKEYARGYRAGRKGYRDWGTRVKYMGSKNRHKSHIKKAMMPFMTPQSTYIEPFCGGCNVIDSIGGRRVGVDIDADLISLWSAVSEGWMPPKNITEDDYYNLRGDKTPSPERGYAAFGLSYGGKKFGGWRRDSKGERNYVDESYRNAEKQFPLLRGVKFICDSYLNSPITKDSVIYCDPPYKGTTAYSSDFSHPEFWNWVRDISRSNHIFVSEYEAPDDFEAVWSKDVASSLTADTGSKRNTEKLWVPRITASKEFFFGKEWP
jgi:DNA adenine methylase